MKKKLYVAILSRGWIRSEMSFDIIPQIIKTPGLDVLFRNYRNCWHVPVSSNRNKITREFRETSCDYLLMIDNDIVPLSNPAELIAASKDIIGMPAKINQDGVLNWSAYVQDPKSKDYAPIDFAKIDPTIDLLKCDAIGTGCILISKKAIEAIEPPWFMEKFDADGVTETGEDMHFCEKARNAGLDIYTTPRRRCEHFHEVGMISFSKNEDIDGYYQRRENLKGKKVVIGLGSGRCGTLSLATLLNYQCAINATHESILLPWKVDLQKFMMYFPRLFIRNNYGLIPSDTASWYINYVKHIIEDLKIDAKFICLKRNLIETTNSWMSKTPNSNHWTKFSSKYWSSEWDRRSVFGQCFPHYDQPKRQAIELYLSNYYLKAELLQSTYPDRFKIFDVENLNTDNGINEILQFIEIDNPKIIKNIKKNATINKDNR